MKLIGITGLARSGKDTLGAHLVEKYGFHLYKMAFPLKRLIAARFGLTFEQVDGGAWRDQPNERFGRHHRRNHPFTLRSWMQWMGTEVGRDTFGTDCWIPSMVKEWEHTNRYACDGCGGMVVSDIRFDNEAKKIIELGGEVYRVVRPGVQAVQDHVSEKGVSENLIAADILNDRDVVTFLNRAEAIIAP